MLKYLWIIVIFLLCFSAFIFSFSKSSTFQVAGDIIHRVDIRDKRVALTFDDGPWDANRTTTVLDILAELHVTGTFFLNGVGIQNYKAAAESIVAFGHEVGNHAYHHERMMFKSNQYVANSISRTNDLIREIGFNGEIYFRPPYGQKLWVLPHYLDSQNITTIMWSLKPEYPSTESSDVIADRIIRNVEPGDIILLHVLNSGSRSSLWALPRVVKQLRQRGYQFVKVSELIVGK